MSVPEALDEWNLGKIEELLRDGYHEDDRFDWKEALNSKDPKHLENIRKAACSFANGRGGFLVFGVSDRGSPQDRIVGIPPDQENAKHLSDKLKQIEPSIDFEVKNPPISLDDGTELVVVQIPASQRGPHWDSSFKIFWKRSHGTAVQMSHAEVEQAFVNYSERLTKVHLIFISLVDNWLRLQAMASLHDSKDSKTKFSQLVPDMSQVRQHMSEAHVLIPEVTGSLMVILRTCDSISTSMSAFLPIVNSPLTQKGSIVADHNASIASQVEGVRPEFEHALDLLQKQFGFQSVSTQHGDVPPLR